jgi:hypothetical protein
MKVSFQGSALSAGQRRLVAFQNQCKPAFLNPVLAIQVAETIRLSDERKEQGAKPEKIWFLEREESGTCSVVEWMGY